MLPKCEGEPEGGGRGGTQSKNQRDSGTPSFVQPPMPLALNPLSIQRGVTPTFPSVPPSHTLSTVFPILFVGDNTGNLSLCPRSSVLTSFFGGWFMSLTSLRLLKLCWTSTSRVYKWQLSSLWASMYAHTHTHRFWSTSPCGLVEFFSPRWCNPVRKAHFTCIEATFQNCRREAARAQPSKILFVFWLYEFFCFHEPCVISSCSIHLSRSQIAHLSLQPAKLCPESSLIWPPSRNPLLFSVTGPVGFSLTAPSFP